jgi:F0F1-type ATP synthase assembly protein I
MISNVDTSVAQMSIVLIAFLLVGSGVGIVLDSAEETPELLDDKVAHVNSTSLQPYRDEVNDTVNDSVNASLPANITSNQSNTSNVTNNDSTVQ